MKRESHQTRTGFTLIELLVTILIIGLLAGMLAGGIAGARRLFAGVTAKQEIDNIKQSLEQYKQKFGEYPPDAFASDVEVKRHILKRWPKTLKAGTADACVTYFNTAVRGISEGSTFPTTPEKVLLFWLCGPERYFWVVNDAGVMTTTLSTEPDARMGFANNPANPFDLVADSTHLCYGKAYPTNDANALKSYEPMLYDLKYDLEITDRKNKGNCNGYALVYKDIPVAYFRSVKVQNGDGKFEPGYWGASAAQRYKYFDFRRAASYIPTYTGGINPAIGYYDVDYEINPDSGLGIAVPYAKNNTWFEEDNYQLILPGEDLKFGNYETFPRDLTKIGTYTFYDKAKASLKRVSAPDMDNVTNFTSGAFLQGEIDQ